MAVMALGGAKPSGLIHTKQRIQSPIGNGVGKRFALRQSAKCYRRNQQALVEPTSVWLSLCVTLWILQSTTAPKAFLCSSLDQSTLKTPPKRQLLQNRKSDHSQRPRQFILDTISAPTQFQKSMLALSRPTDTKLTCLAVQTFCM